MGRVPNLRDDFSCQHFYHFIVNQVPVQALGKTRPDLATDAAILTRDRDGLHFSPAGLIVLIFFSFLL